MRPTPQVIDLFSGIGGFSLAAHVVGFETAAFCEIDPYCQRVLRRHWPDVPIFDDVKELTADALADTSARPLILTGGFPCQDISYAGKGAGLAGERSGLFFEVARLVGELRPDYVLLENVAALLTRGLDAVLGTLVSLGYDALWACVPACAVGAPHRRDRVWIVAIQESPDSRQRLEAMYEHVLSRLTPFGDLAVGQPTATASDAWGNDLDRNGVVGKHNLGLGQAARGETWPTATAASGENSGTGGLGGGSGGAAKLYANLPEGEARSMRGGALNPDWVETLMGYHVGYTLPDGGPMVTLPTRWPAGLGAEQYEWEPPRLTSVRENKANRLKCLGNSIVPQVALRWMEAIKADKEYR